MSIVTLTDKNFSVLGSREKSLVINIPGPVLVFFRSRVCNICKSFQPIFEQFSRVEGRVRCAIIDVSDYRSVMEMSRSTKIPITATPILLLYIEGKPFARFNGSRTINSLQDFLTKVLDTARPASFVKPQENMYGGYNPNTPVRAPDITPPSLKGKINGPTPMGVEEEADSSLRVPPTAIPHNKPWEAEYRKLESF